MRRTRSPTPCSVAETPSSWGISTVPRIDKHSTSGVGDKVSIVLAPLIASLGVAVPMMSGRGLGHTGGTLDKLESIPGFDTNLALYEARKLLETLNCALFGQTEEIAPADRKMYALRDATGTVESIPLIAASIMSKKLAEGLTGLVLDVKRGSGAFLPDLERGLELANTMIALGADQCPVVALVTAMDRPLGRACGNALEIEESIAALKGEGPADLMEVTYALGAEMLLLAAAAKDREDARMMMEGARSTSGKAAEHFQRIIEAQGGNPGVVDDPAILPQAEEVELFIAARRGFISRVEPRTIGRGIAALGGGRTKMEDKLDLSVGFVITARPGDWVEQGEAIATIFARDRSGIESGRATLRAAVTIADEANPPLPLVSHRVTASGVEVLAP